MFGLAFVTFFIALILSAFFVPIDALSIAAHRASNESAVFLLKARQVAAERLCSGGCPDGVVFVPGQPTSGAAGSLGTVSLNGVVISYFLASTPAKGQQLLTPSRQLDPGVLSVIGTYDRTKQIVTGIPFSTHSLAVPPLNSPIAAGAGIPDQAIVLMERRL